MKDSKMSLLDFKKEQLIHLNGEELKNVKGGNPTALCTTLMGPRIFYPFDLRKDFSWWPSAKRRVICGMEDAVRIAPIKGDKTAGHIGILEDTLTFD